MEEKINRIEKAVEQTQGDVKSLTGVVARIEEAVTQTQSDVKDLTLIVAAIAGNMVTKVELAAVETRLDKKIDAVREELVGKISGVQRAVDSEFERQSMLETHISKIEAELHL